MASDLDTVRALRALFHDLPKAPPGLPPQETMAWIQRSMSDFEGGDMAYALEHITRSSLLDIVLRFREDGHLQEDRAFEDALRDLATPEGRKTFMDHCIQAQKSVDAADRLIRRAKRSMSDPDPLFGFDVEAIERFVAALPTGPGPLYAEFVAREDAREIGVCGQEAEAIYEFDWGFVTEVAGSWNVYIADVWRKGTVGYFLRFMSAWQMELSIQPDGSTLMPPPLPAGLSVDDGIGHFCALTIDGGPHLKAPAVRRWMGETFLARMLPYMAGRAVDDDYDFPALVQA